MILVDPFQLRIFCDWIHPWPSQFCLSSDTKGAFKPFCCHTGMSLGLWDTSGTSQHPEWPTFQIMETQGRAGGYRHCHHPSHHRGQFAPGICEDIRQEGTGHMAFPALPRVHSAAWPPGFQSFKMASLCFLFRLVHALDTLKNSLQAFKPHISYSVWYLANKSLKTF